jgi:arylsulfatase A-like enzyme
MKRPNILFVFADQLRYTALGSSGNPVVRTPHLDRLASEGVVFEQAFSNCPICSPFRGTLLTGKYPHKNGVVDNEYRLFPGQDTLPRVLGQAGYRTGFVGKWHLGYGPYTEDKRHGFDYLAANNCIHDYYKVRYHENERGPITVDGWAPDDETSLGIRFMQDHVRRGDDSPFMLMLGWGPPHWPYKQYPDEYNVYDPAAVDLPKNVPVQMADFARREIAHYYGNVTGLDAQMGRLLESLDRLGVAEDTIVCFTSDHGDHLSSHGYGKPMDQWMHHSMRASKATPYDESIHIPFLVRWPAAIEPGRRTSALFSAIDMMPTLLGLCGVESPAGVQGSFLSHELTGGEGTARDSVYLQILGPGWPHRGPWVGFWRGVRTDRWLYARWHADEREPLLIDLTEDRWEMRNLAGQPDHAATQRQMEARLRQWIAETDDPFDSGERELTTGMLALGQQFTSDRWDTD